ncbi:hypothetical protein [Bacteroides acidifaciens]|uniref:hypothetical protein n=1 Tax=Bacteroides acidifaciens TaxID=85831 RepID=UPI002599F036|nr:hypothetical protein [Bacteroides acidifaciens]
MLKNTVKRIRNISHNVLRRFNETLNVRKVSAVSAVLAWSFSQSVSYFRIYFLCLGMASNV